MTFLYSLDNGTIKDFKKRVILSMFISQNCKIAMNIYKYKMSERYTMYGCPCLVNYSSLKYIFVIVDQVLNISWKFSSFLLFMKLKRKIANV